MPGEDGIISTELLGVNIIAGLCFWNGSEDTKDFWLHDAMLLFSLLLLWTRTKQNSKAREILHKERKRDPSLNKKFIKYPRLTFQILKPMRAPVNFNGKKAGKKKNYWTLSNLATCHALTFARRKENIKPSPVGPLFTCHHTNK